MVIKVTWLSNPLILSKRCLAIGVQSKRKGANEGDKEMKALLFVVARLKERSTWLGILGIVTAAGISLSPEQVEAITAVGVAVGGLILVLTKDKE